MNIQQANFVKEILSQDKNLDNLAKEFYLKYGSTNYCVGPTETVYEKGRKVLVFSKFDGYDLKNEAARFLRQKL